MTISMRCGFLVTIVVLIHAFLPSDLEGQFCHECRETLACITFGSWHPECEHSFDLSQGEECEANPWASQCRACGWMSGCHTNWEPGPCHVPCPVDLAARQDEAERLIVLATRAEGSEQHRATSIQALVQTVEEDPWLICESSRHVIQVRDCFGEVIREWAIPESVALTGRTL